MRRVFLKEGDLGYVVILPNAIQFDPDAIYPVCWAGRAFDYEPAGFVEQIQRSEEGMLSGVFEFAKQTKKLIQEYDDRVPGSFFDSFEFSACCTDIKFDTNDEGDKRIIRSAVLRSINIIPQAGYPKKES